MKVSSSGMRLAAAAIGVVTAVFSVAQARPGPLQRAGRLVDSARPGGRRAGSNGSGAQGLLEARVD